MIAHQIKITVFAKQDDDENKIKGHLLKLVPFDIEKEKIELVETSSAGFNEKPIKIFEILIKKERHIKEFIENLLNKLDSGTKELILRQAETRMDNDFNFYLRFDKDKWINEGELYLTDRGSCFHIKISLAAFPKNKEKSMEIIQKVFKSGN